MPIVIHSRLLSVLFILLSAAILGLPPPSIASADNQKTLLVYGVSLSAAYGLEIENGRVSLLKEKMKQTKPG